MHIRSLKVGRAIARLDLTRRYDRARSDDAIYLYQLSAAQRHGVFEPFDADATELNAWLLSVHAGRDLCRAAWDSFMDDNDGDEVRSGAKQAG